MFATSFVSEQDALLPSTDEGPPVKASTEPQDALRVVALALLLAAMAIVIWFVCIHPFLPEDL